MIFDLQVFRHIAIYDTVRQSFYDSCFTHTRLTNQYRVVLRSAGKYMQRSAYLFITAYHRIQLAIAGQFVQVLGIALQGIVLLVRCLRIYRTTFSQFFYSSNQSFSVRPASFKSLAVLSF